MDINCNLGKALMGSSWKSFIKNKIKRNYFLYRILLWDIWGLTSSTTLKNYPVDVNIELTTVCNLKCSFCIHEELIQNGKRISKHMDYTLAIKSIDKIKKITTKQEIPDEKIIFRPVGLGEPLVYPHLIDVLHYIRKLFPKSQIFINTNCLALKGKIAQDLLGLIDKLTLSLAFDNANDYKKWMRLDIYDKITDNIKNFLEMKGDRLPNADLYIFDEGLTYKKFSEFLKRWGPYLNKNDFFHIRKLLSSAYWKKRPGKKYPCSQLWRVLVVDVDGFILPCCPGIWMKRNPILVIGHINDDCTQIFSKLNALRKMHIDGKFGICENCAYLAERAIICKKDFQLAQKEKVEFIKINSQ